MVAPVITEESQKDLYPVFATAVNELANQMFAASVTELAHQNYLEDYHVVAAAVTQVARQIDH